LSVSTHSLTMTPPELMQNIESISLFISYSARDLTQGLSLYFTSCSASLKFSVSFIPEWANIILLKVTNSPFASLTFITGPEFPMMITYVSLSLCSIVIPGLVIGLLQV